MKKKIVLCLMVCVFVVSMLTGCGCSKADMIAGTYVDSKTNEIVVIKADGTGTIGGLSLSWVFDKNDPNKLLVSTALLNFNCVYDSSNETLTYSDKYSTYVYKKQKK